MQLDQLDSVLALARRFLESADSELKPQWEQLQSVVLEQKVQRDASVQELLQARLRALGPLGWQALECGPLV